MRRGKLLENSCSKIKQINKPKRNKIIKCPVTGLIERTGQSEKARKLKIFMIQNFKSMPPKKIKLNQIKVVGIMGYLRFKALIKASNQWAAKYTRPITTPVSFKSLKYRRQTHRVWSSKRPHLANHSPRHNVTPKTTFRCSKSTLKISKCGCRLQYFIRRDPRQSKAHLHSKMTICRLPQKRVTLIS